MSVEATRNANSDTWRIVVHIPGKPDMICPNAPWSVVESVTAMPAAHSTNSPGAFASAVGWVAAPVLMLVCNPWFWLCAAVGGGLHTCGS